MSTELSISEQLAQLFDVALEIHGDAKKALDRDRLSDLYALADDVEGAIKAHPTMLETVRESYYAEVADAIFGPYLACSLYAKKHGLKDPPKRKI